MIAGKGYPPGGNTARLCECVPQRGESAIGGVIGRGVVYGNDGSPDWGQYRSSETWEMFWGLGAYERLHPNWCCFIGSVSGYEVDGVRGREASGPMAGYAIGWTILCQPPTRERER